MWGWEWDGVGPLTGDPNNIIDPRICLVLKVAAYLSIMGKSKGLRIAFTMLWKGYSIHFQD